jgi:hypothetical protein
MGGRVLAIHREDRSRDRGDGSAGDVRLDDGDARHAEADDRDLGLG